MGFRLRVAGRGWLGVLRVVCVVMVVCVGCAVFAGSAWAGVGWSVHAVAEPSSFSASDAVVCEAEKKCDRYQLLVLNTGDERSSGLVTIQDTLPRGIHILEEPESGSGLNEGTWHCTESEAAEHEIVTCDLLNELEEPQEIEQGHYAAYLDIIVSAPTEKMTGVLENEVTMEGGGAPTVSRVEDTPIDVAPVFEVNEFTFEPGVAGGLASFEAGGHPWELTESFGVPSGMSPPKGHQGVHHFFSPARNFKNVVVELPVGFLGDPQATEQCDESALRDHECPEKSQVGVYGILNSGTHEGEYGFTGEETTGCCSAVYNMVPEAGYPAEFGFTFATNVPVLIYANVVHTGTGYRLRVTVPGVPTTEETLESTLTLFGEPGALNGSGSTAAFMSNPADCSAESEGVWNGAVGSAKGSAARIELEPWGEPGHIVTGETVAYPQLTECNLLQFNPSLSFGPSSPAAEGTTQADTPSAYTTSLKIPQTTEYSEPSTPDLRNATVSLPAGVTINPPAGEGLLGCRAEGPEGINIGSDKIGAGGRDEGDPEATELGAGHPGGNNSPYDDGFYHAAPGHCPGASAIGAAEVFTPLLPSRCGGVGQAVCQPGESPAPLQGRVFVAEPKCGGEGQPLCTEASASNGELFGVYLEVQGSGIIVKAAGTLSANPQTGQLTASFRENPQFPFSELKLNLRGGARAPLANPQTCGPAAASWSMSSWAGQEPTGSTLPFAATGCAATMPFAPAFTAGTISPAAGAFSALTLTFSRQDGEQDFSGLTETLPGGLGALLATVPLCGEPQAGNGECPQASQIGSTTVAAGAGEDPLVREGGVYLTTGYKGAPFGLSIVVPANAGPFHLGNVTVRAAITVNPTTGAATVVSDPLPQAKDGVPFRLRSVNVNIDRPGFAYNPTNCEAKQITATITATQGATANVASPFQATGCQNLPFKPVFTESTQGKTSKVDGASLTVTDTQNPGEANIHKVQVQLPVALPSRLSTLQKACLAAQFNANPAGCPEGSQVGTATATTPVLNEPLRGPAYLVARGTEFPDLEFVLQGEGVTIILDGKTDIKKGVTYSNFETVPDAPVTSFVASFPEGPHSVLAANVNLCAPTETITVTKHVIRRIHGHRRHTTIKVKKTIPKPLISPITLTGQNGTVIKQTTKIAVTGCPTKKPAKPAKKKKKHKTKK